MSHLLESLMYQASQVFLFPTLVVITVLFVYAFFLLGMFAMQWWQRRQGQGGQPTRGHHLLAWAQAQPGASADELDVKAHQLLELQHFHAGEQFADEGVQHRREKDEGVFAVAQFGRQANDARQHARRLHDGGTGAAAEGILAFEFDGEIQALVEHARKGMRRANILSGAVAENCVGASSSGVASAGSTITGQASRQDSAAPSGCAETRGKRRDSGQASASSPR